MSVVCARERGRATATHFSINTVTRERSSLARATPERFALPAPRNPVTMINGVLPLSGGGVPVPGDFYTLVWDSCVFWCSLWEVFSTHHHLERPFYQTTFFSQNFRTGLALQSTTSLFWSFIIYNHIISERPEFIITSYSIDFHDLFLVLFMMMMMMMISSPKVDDQALACARARLEGNAGQPNARRRPPDQALLWRPQRPLRGRRRRRRARRLDLALGAVSREFRQ